MKKRHTTLKADLPRSSVRLTKKDQDRLVQIGEDFNSDRYREAWGKVTALRHKLKKAEEEAFEFGERVLAFASRKQ